MGALWCTALLAAVAAGTPSQPLKTVPCANLSIYSLRVVLQELLESKKSPRVAGYPMYESAAEMKQAWRSLPGVQPGNNPNSLLVKHAHCHEAVMWYSQHLDQSEKESFAQRNFLPLLPEGGNLLSKLGDSATDSKLKLFYESKVLCSECSEPETERKEEAIISV